VSPSSSIFSDSSTPSLSLLSVLDPGRGLNGGDDELSVSLLSEEPWGMLLNFSTFWPAYIF